MQHWYLEVAKTGVYIGIDASPHELPIVRCELADIGLPTGEWISGDLPAGNGKPYSHWIQLSDQVIEKMEIYIDEISVTLGKLGFQKDETTQITHWENVNTFDEFPGWIFTMKLKPSMRRDIGAIGDAYRVDDIVQFVSGQKYRHTRYLIARVFNTSPRRRALGTVTRAFIDNTQAFTSSGRTSVDAQWITETDAPYFWQGRSNANIGDDLKDAMEKHLRYASLASLRGIRRQRLDSIHAIQEGLRLMAYKVGFGLDGANTVLATPIYAQLPVESLWAFNRTRSLELALISARNHKIGFIAQLGLYSQPMVSLAKGLDENFWLSFKQQFSDT